MPSPHLERKLKEVLGDDAGVKLGGVIDRTDPIRTDIAELRHHMEITLEKGLREQSRFLFAWWAVLMLAVVGLYGTVIALVR